MATLGDVVIPNVTLGQLMQSAPGTTNVPTVSPQQVATASPTLGDAIKKPKIQWWQIAGVLGDALQAANGGKGSFVPEFLDQREKQAELQQNYDLAERKFNNELEVARYNRDHPAPTSFQQNVGYLQQNYPDRVDSYVSKETNDTLWRQDPATGQFIPYDPTPAAPTKPVGKLTPIAPTISNTPAPALGASGLPTTLTPQQYQATVNAMGKASTDAWMARNGIKVGA